MYNLLLSPTVANEHVEFIGLVYIIANNRDTVELTTSSENE